VTARLTREEVAECLILASSAAIVICAAMFVGYTLGAP